MSLKAEIVSFPIPLVSSLGGKYMVHSWPRFVWKLTFKDSSNKVSERDIIGGHLLIFLPKNSSFINHGESGEKYLLYLLYKKKRQSVKIE